jgi:hypothetical protein
VPRSVTPKTGWICAHCGEELQFEDLREAAHCQISGKTGDGKWVATWSRPKQVLIDYIAALEEHLEGHS